MDHSAGRCLEYHSTSPAGKVAVVPTKPCRTQRDLSLAYTPGVAVPCLEIEKDPSLAYKYTAKGNLVAVVTNGTAVLGLGNIGAAAGKPVMEGKGVLFKRFADIDVFDIELEHREPRGDHPHLPVARTDLRRHQPGGHQGARVLLDRRRTAPHDEDPGIPRRPARHGHHLRRALLNALELAGKNIAEVKVVFNGAGASGISCAEHYVKLGVRRENILMCDTSGVIYKGRTKGMNPYKERFARETGRRAR